MIPNIAPHKYMMLGRQQGKSLFTYVYYGYKMIDPEYVWMSPHSLWNWYKWCRNFKLTCIALNEA